MSENPDNEQPVFTKSEMNAIVQQRLSQDRARRGNPPPASSAPAPAAPATSGMDARMDKLESMFGTLIERLTPAAPTSAPAAAAAPSAPAAAPSAPQPHSLSTSGGLLNMWALTPAQIDQMGPDGVRQQLEEAWRIGHKMAGAPTRPEPPGSVKSLESEVRALARAVRKGS
jgi:hypothetical protein